MWGRVWGLGVGEVGGVGVAGVGGGGWWWGGWVEVVGEVWGGGGGGGGGWWRRCVGLVEEV